MQGVLSSSCRSEDGFVCLYVHTVMQVDTVWWLVVTGADEAMLDASVVGLTDWILSFFFVAEVVNGMSVGKN